MLHQESFQALARGPLLRPSDKPLIEHDPYTDIPAFEWNAPCPPAFADNVVRRRPSNAVTGHGPIGKFLREFAAIPILHARPACPDGSSRMIRIWPPPTLLPRQDCRD